MACGYGFLGFAGGLDMWFRCDNCDSYLAYENYDDVPTRKARLEDCCDPDVRIAICPTCGEEIYKVNSCMVCGGVSEGKDYCPACISAVKADFAVITTKYAKLNDKSSENIEEHLLNILCEY